MSNEKQHKSILLNQTKLELIVTIENISISDNLRIKLSPDVIYIIYRCWKHSK